MMVTLITALRATLFLTVLAGLVYPLMITGVAQLVFRDEAKGSLIFHEGRLVGSSLLAHKIEDKAYFWFRPSAGDYETIPSKASHLSPARREFVEKVAQRQSHLGPNAPSDLLTASASGLDPHVTEEGAFFQVKRIAHERRLSPTDVKLLGEIVRKNVEDKTLGLFGVRRVNIMALNMAINESFPKK